MATEEQKKIRQLRVFNQIIAGLAKGFYDLFGDSAGSVAGPIGELIIQEMEHDCALELQGEDPQAILTELGRLLVDEYGLLQKASLRINDEAQEIDIVCEGCLLWSATERLMAAGVRPFTCAPMMIAGAAMRKRLGKKTMLLGISQDPAKKQCTIHLAEFD